jgi:hypothetical protein
LERGAASREVEVVEIPETDSRSKAMSWADWKRWRRLFFEAMANDAFESGDDGGGARGKIRRVVVEDGGHGLSGGVALEGALAGDHFVQDAAETEDVGAMIDGFAANLLGGHVADRAEDLSGIGLRGDEGGAVGAFAEWPGAAQLGEAEIQNFQLAGAGDENIFRLQVAVDDALVVGGSQAVCQVDSEFDGFAGRHSGRGNAFAQGFAFEEFRDDVVNPVGGADVVDGNDVGMIEGGDGAGFLFEAAQAIGIVGEGGGQNFQGDVAQEAGVAGAVDRFSATTYSPGLRRASSRVSSRNASAASNALSEGSA